MLLQQWLQRIRSDHSVGGEIGDQDAVALGTQLGIGGADLAVDDHFDVVVATLADLGIDLEAVAAGGDHHPAEAEGIAGAHDSRRIVRIGAIFDHDHQALAATGQDLAVFACPLRCQQGVRGMRGDRTG